MKNVLAACLALSLLASCVTEGQPQGGPATQGNQYFLNYRYVDAARADGNAAFDRLVAGQDEQARALFARSTTTLSSGAAQHRRAAAERAQTVSTLGAILAAGVGIAAIQNADVRTAAGQNRLQGQLNAVTQVSDMIGNGAQDFAASRITADARSVAVNQWRSAVISDHRVARSIVRVQNRTTGGYCTGFFVRPRIIATASHCFDLNHAVSAERQQPENGGNFMRGSAAAIPLLRQTVNLGFENCPGARNDNERVNRCGKEDFAYLVTRDASPHFIPIGLPATAGERLTTIGYSGDLNRGYFLRIDVGCAIQSVRPGNLVTTNCTGFPGDSGGPLVRITPGRGIGIEAVGIASSGRTGGSLTRETGFRTYAPANGVNVLLSQTGDTGQ